MNKIKCKHNSNFQCEIGENQKHECARDGLPGNNRGIKNCCYQKKVVTPIMKYFTYKHLPEKLQKISEPFCELAKIIDEEIPNGPEKSAGLRKLLEAKDCIVRAALD